MFLTHSGVAIIKKLCEIIEPVKLYSSFAKILESEVDYDFAGIINNNSTYTKARMTQLLNLILLTSKECDILRSTLKSDNEFFENLYVCWCHSPVSVLSLCLLSGAYDNAAKIIELYTAEFEIDAEFLIQLDALVQLLESPSFTALRVKVYKPIY